MAWMFAGTENDMSVGMHLHYHIVPPAPSPVPFYPHPALGIARDKFASKTKVDNRKAARTGTKFKVLLPPHLPWIGPLTHGTGKEGTGIQTGWMGAGIGAHPFGGIGFVVIEGKPAIGMLSNLLGCWCVAPGFDMMLPFIGLDFLMIPTRMPTVLYGPAPLAIDLLVMLMALIEALLDYLIGFIKIPILEDIAEVAKDAIMEGVETACTAYESGVRPISECLAQGAAAAGHSFVSGMVEFAAEAVTGPLGDIPVVGGVVQEWAQGQITDAANEAIGEHLPGYNEYLEAQENDESGPTPGGVFGAIDTIGTAFGEGANANAEDGHPPGLAIEAGLDNAVRDFAREEVSSTVAEAVTPEGEEPGLAANMLGAVVGGGLVPARELPDPPNPPGGGDDAPPPGGVIERDDGVLVAGD